MPSLTFAAGLFIGACMGLILTALCVAAQRGDERLPEKGATDE